MNKAFDHTQAEQEIYKQWEVSGAFRAPLSVEAKTAGKKPFTIIMPPPNANDPLHVGHAMFISLEDILIRYHRMLGEATLWLPGTDHAGIETQYVFEKKLNKEGKSRFNYDRETLFQMIWDYVQENSGVAIDQMKKLGASADWSRQRFTLHERCVDLTLQTFETMHQDKLIVRKQSLVNYCTKCGTAYSQLEINHEERTSPLYFVRYPHADNIQTYEVVATTRPEPIFADTHLAVHPKDPKRNCLIGKQLLNPITNLPMEIIADEFVNPEFGTGLVKLTPAHDHNDFEVAQKHKLPLVEAITKQGKMSEAAGDLAGLPVKEARKRVVETLRENGLLDHVDETYQNSVATCYRCGREIEPLPMAQFFITVENLTKHVLPVLDQKKTVIYGAGHDKILRHWLTDLKDWNISRQIVWGIRLPVWYNLGISNESLSEQPNAQILVGFLDEKGSYVQGTVEHLLQEYPFELIEKNLQTLTAPIEARYVLSRTKPNNKERWLQETDTFDTWFSSSQWPVNTLKTTEEGDFDYYYPTQVMETGYDILPFWVMRMMMMGLYLTGKTPFEVVYLHGLVRDEKGRKMSKSKGNVINPLTLVEMYGADALRMALVMSTTAGHDSAVGENKVKGMRNFANKIWNAARFISMMEVEEHHQGAPEDSFEAQMGKVVMDVTEALNSMRLGQAAEIVHNEFWHWFCDQCIESAKEGMLSKVSLRKGFKTFLLLLHPFVPFVTEAVWQEMDFEGMLITQSWPRA